MDKWLQEINNAANEISKKVRSKEIELDYKIKVAELDHSEYRAVAILGLFGSIVGIVAAALGFRLWYRRVQVLQDAILRKEIETTGDK